MEKTMLRRRWLILFIFFNFLFIQQFDILLSEPIREKVIDVFGSAFTLSENFIYILLVLVTLSFLIWGINFDKHSRRNLLVLACVFWWATSWLAGLAPTMETFLLSYGSGIMDFGSMVGIYALLGDFFIPRNRGKVFGLMQAVQPFAHYIVLLYFNNLFLTANWRSYLFVLGIVGLTFGLIILLFVKEPKKGLTEPALSGIQISGQYFFDWETARDMAGKPSFIILCGLSLFSILPWTGLSEWISTLLQSNQNLIDISEYALISPIILAVILGNILGGVLGDTLSRWLVRGRVIANIIVLLLAFLTSVTAFLVGDTSKLVFRILISLTALFITMSRPGIFTLLYEITLPEIRGTTTALIFIFQLFGVIIGLVLIRIMEVTFSTWTIFFSLTLSSVMINLLLSTALYRRISLEVENLRRHMAYRSQLESRLESRK